MSYAPTAKYGIEFNPSGDDGAIIRSNNNIWAPPSRHVISVEMELRPRRADSGRAVLFNYMDYDGAGASVAGINVERWKNDLELTWAGSVGVYGIAGVGPIFLNDQERVFFRVAVQYRVGPPAQCRFIIWRNRDAAITGAWSNFVLDYPPAQKWAFMRRRVTPDDLPLSPFWGRVYQMNVAKAYWGIVGHPMRYDGFESAAAWQSVYGLTAGAGTVITDSKGANHCTLYPGAAPSSWQWVAERWLHLETSDFQHPSSQKRQHVAILGRRGR